MTTVGFSRNSESGDGPIGMSSRLILILAFSIACGGREPVVPNAPPTVRADPMSTFAGCYSVHAGAWQPPFPNSAAFRIPSRVQLTRDFVPEVPPREPAVQHGPYYFSMRSFDDPSPVLGKWALTGNRQVTLIWIGSPAAIKAVVARDVVGEDLSGTATPMPANGSSAAISLQRAPC